MASQYDGFIEALVEKLEDPELSAGDKVLFDGLIDQIEKFTIDLVLARADVRGLSEKVNILMKRQDRAIEILKTIEWVGSGAKGRISDAIGILYGEEPENENDNMV